MLMPVDPPDAASVLPSLSLPQAARPAVAVRAIPAMKNLRIETFMVVAFPRRMFNCLLVVRGPTAGGLVFLKVFFADQATVTTIDCQPDEPLGKGSARSSTWISPSPSTART
ncbi:hypothetical protein Kisp02_06290 [Kineosporia sp. NBRC 101731]|nr:hypothetical protein Kisp02_06290 [Kineosporia sp. NBRC 101731]